MSIFDIATAAAPLNTDSAPDYPDFVANLDYHNQGNENTSWYDTITNAPKYLGVSIASGINSMYNTGSWVGSWLSGSEYEERDTAAWISSTFDDNLGEYYTEHKQGADALGFLITSIVPGMAGVKLLNAGQKVLAGARTFGFMGANLSGATGLLVDGTATYAARAGAQIAQSATKLDMLNSLTLKAVASGAKQGVLEGVAWEAAVQATMQKSPMLNDADHSDMFSNIATAGLFGGAFGAAFSAAKTFNTARKVIKASDTPEKAVTHFHEYPSATPAQQIIAHTDDLHSIAAVDLNGLAEVGAKGNAELAAKLVPRYAQSQSKTLEKLVNFKKLAFVKLAKGNAEIGSNMHNELFTANTKELTPLLFGAKSISHLGSALKDTEDSVLSYLILRGEGRGVVAESAPKFMRLIDKLGTKEAVQEEIKLQARQHGFVGSKSVDLLATSSKNLVDTFEARRIWLNENPISSDIAQLNIREHDIPLLDHIYNKSVGNNIPFINIIKEDGKQVMLEDKKDLLHFISDNKETVFIKIADKYKKELKLVNQEEIASAINVKNSFVTGTRTSDVASDIFADISANKAYSDAMSKQGLNPDNLLLNTDYLHTAIKLESAYSPVNLHELDAMAAMKSLYKIYDRDISLVAAELTGKHKIAEFPEFPDEAVLSATRVDNGATLVGASNGSFGSAAAYAQAIGAHVKTLIQKMHANTTETLQSVLTRIARNPEEAIELEAINTKLARSPELYVANDTFTHLTPKQFVGKELTAEQAELVIPIKSLNVQEYIKAHVDLNSSRIDFQSKLRSVQGMPTALDPLVVRPVRPDPKLYQHYAFVTDAKITGVGHKSMLHATSGEELAALISKVNALDTGSGRFKVITKDSSALFHQAEQDYAHELSLHENYIDHTIKSKGINSSFFPMTDPAQIAAKFLDHHLASDSVLAREMTLGKYEKQFGELNRQAELLTEAEASKYASSKDFIKASVKNPYTDLVKMALNTSRISEYPWVEGLNTRLNKTVGKLMNAVQSNVHEAKSIDDVVAANKMLQDAGLNCAYQDAATMALVNHPAGAAPVDEFVRKANSILGALTCGLDPLNALTNSVGSTILLGAETRNVMNGIRKANIETVGKELASFMHIKIPGMEEAIRSPAKAIAAAHTKVLGEGKDAILKYAIERGHVDPTMASMQQNLLDTLTLRGNETADMLSSKFSGKLMESVKKLNEKGSTWTGNKWAEIHSRLTAIQVALDIVEPAVKSGNMTASARDVFVNSFLNRVQGNLVASQKPLMFQGAIGQAIGLFQSYQLNMTQQLLRYVGEGNAKSAAIAVGLQGTLYGLNGVPGFHAINNHLIGNMAGNKDHNDVMTALSGDDFGAWVAYGLPSNLLRANLYTRGDMNPRNATLIPTSLDEVPIVGATTKFVKNILNTTERLANGADVKQALLQGIEHNALSRPLSGAAMVAQGLLGDQVYSTTSKGNMLGHNDLLTWSSFVRLAGGRPLEEAYTNDAIYRALAYRASDKANADMLAQVVRTKIANGETPSQEDIDNFAARFVESGRKQKDFNKYMLNLMTSVNTTQADNLTHNLKSPTSRYIQQFMSGSQD